MKRERLNIRWALQWLGGLWVLLASVSLWALIALNSIFIYRLVINFSDLTSVTGLSAGSLMENYRQIVAYLQLPWVQELRMPDFYMSETGRIHFEEVKVIFQALYLILILFIVTWVIGVKKEVEVLSIFNKGANLIFTFFGLIGMGIMVDFSQAFVWFHRLIFNNDYWIFNAVTDPVILALPEELFMILGVMVIVILFSQSLLIKYFYFKNKRKSPLLGNTHLASTK